MSKNALPFRAPARDAPTGDGERGANQRFCPPAFANAEGQALAFEKVGKTLRKLFYR